MINTHLEIKNNNNQDIKKYLINYGNHGNFENKQKTFYIFMIFIKNQNQKNQKHNTYTYNKKAIINELEKLKSNGHLLGDMNEFYKTFKPMVIPLFKIYSLLNEKLKLQKKSKINNKTKSKTKSDKSTKSKKSKKGGFLFMLEDKKDQPITGKDLTDVLNKFEQSLNLIYYTKYGRDGTVTSPSGEEMTTDVANPLTALKTILDFSRKKVSEGLSDQSSTLMKAISNMDLSEIANAYSYYNLYKLYNEEYLKSESSSKKQLIQKINQGPPKEPGSSQEPVLGQKKNTDNLKIQSTSPPPRMLRSKFNRIKNDLQKIGLIK
jgi:hypothetical protein